MTISCLGGQILSLGLDITKHLSVVHFGFFVPKNSLCDAKGTFSQVDKSKCRWLCAFTLIFPNSGSSDIGAHSISTLNQLMLCPSVSSGKIEEPPTQSQNCQQHEPMINLKV
jgi:hypothetical protein